MGSFVNIIVLFGLLDIIEEEKGNRHEIRLIVPKQILKMYSNNVSLSSLTGRSTYLAEYKPP